MKNETIEVMNEQINKRMNWIETDEYMIGYYKKESYNSLFSKKIPIAAFDLDSTIIEPTNNKKFSTGSTDWKFFDDNVINKLHKLNEKYNIVIISNQNGIQTGKTNKNTWKQKLFNVVSKIDIPVTILVSIKKNLYRKPNTKLWDEFIISNIKKSFYCGDAAGLPRRKICNRELPRDFSDSDYKFALNVGIEFIHRDQFIFDLKKPKNKIPIKYINFSDIQVGKYKNNKPNHPEMIINVGFPGSGKTYYTKNYLINDYEHINQDELKTEKKCLNKCEELMKKGYSVVIDNTNPSKDKRKKFIELAQKYDYNCKCNYFKTSKELSIHI